MVDIIFGFTFSDDLCESKSWLACNVESWSEVMEQWNKTFSRRQQSNTKAVAEFLQQYPILKLNKAPTLVCTFDITNFCDKYSLVAG